MSGLLAFGVFICLSLLLCGFGGWSCGRLKQEKEHQVDAIP
jgi:hypothetical protein